MLGVDLTLDLDLDLVLDLVHEPQVLDPSISDLRYILKTQSNGRMNRLNLYIP